MNAQETVRELLAFVLEAHQAAGRTLHVPVGCTGSEPWLLDSLDVPALLDLIRQGKPVPLSKLCKSGVMGNQAQAHSSAAQPGPDPMAKRAHSNGPEAPPAAASFNADGPGREPFTAASAQPANANEPVLELAALDTGLEEFELKDLAYTVFAGACGRSADPDIIRTVCNQLDMSESRAAEMQQAMDASPSARTPAFSRHAASLKLQAELLQTVRPGHFASFRAFVMWRQTSGRLMAQVLARALQSTPGLDWSNRNGRPRFAVAHLQGALRRLDVRNPDEYVEAEYAVAAKDFVAAASDIASHCSSGWRFPWAVRVRVADLLLRGLFESDDSGAYVEDRTALLSLLENQLWPLLGISPQVHAALYAWIHFRQFALTGRRSLLVATQQLIGNLMAESSRRKSAANGDESTSDEALDSQFGADVAAAVETWILKRMRDYHLAFAGDAILMAGLLEVLIAAELCKGKNAAVHQMLESCVASSLDAQMGRMQEQAASSSGPDSADQLHRLARYTHRVLKVESETFTPVLSEHLPAAGAIAAAHLHRAFGSVFLPWLLTVDSLVESTLTTVRAADGLEAALKTHARTRASTGNLGLDGLANGNTSRGEAGMVPDMPAWDTLHRMAPLLFHWVQSQLAQLGAWTSRILESESWQPISPSRLLSRSAVEIIKIATETIEGLFAMQLPLPVDLVRCLTEGIDSIMQRYAKAVQEQVGSPDVFIPPPPALTRYKKDLAVKAEALETSPQATPKNRAPPPTPSSHEQGLDVAEERAAVLTAESLLVRLNSLHYLGAGLPEMEAAVRDRWEEAVSGAAGGSAELDSGHWLHGVFEGADVTIRRAVEGVSPVLASRTIWWDLRKAVLEELWKHRVDKARMGQLLGQLDQKLGDLAAHLPTPLHPPLITSLLQATADALVRVLLDGGPFRFFAPEDCGMIEEDLDALAALFHADGEGLPRQDVDRILNPIHELLTVLQIDTPILIDNFKQARTRGAPAGNGRLLAYDPAVIQHVLAHRPDHAASKFLKKEFRLPKKVGSSSGAPAFIGNFGASKQLNGLMAATKSGLASRPSFMGPAAGANGSPTAKPGPAAGSSGRSKGAFSKWTSRVRDRL